MNFKFSDEEYNYVLNTCTNFAINEFNSSKIKRYERKQFNKDRIIQQNIIGKIGEFAAMFYLLDQGHECNSPDMKVYDGPKKSFDADLILNGKPLHVKSQSKMTSSYLKCVSWTFQKGGKGAGHVDPLTQNKCEDLIVFCHVDKKQTMVYGPYKWNDVRSLLKDPLLDRLKGIKQCIYLEDLLKI